MPRELELNLEQMPARFLPPEAQCAEGAGLSEWGASHGWVLIATLREIVSLFKGGLRAERRKITAIKCICSRTLRTKGSIVDVFLVFCYTFVPLSWFHVFVRIWLGACVLFR